MTLETKGMNAVTRFLNPLLSPNDARHTIGIAIAVRKDGKQLHLWHMAAMIDYGRELIMERGDLAFLYMWTQADLEKVTKAHFMAWYKKWSAQKISAGIISVDFPSPYQV